MAPKAYKKRTNRTFSEEAMAQALSSVLNDNMSIRKSAQLHGVTKSRLYDYVKKTKVEGADNIKLVPTFRVRQVFSEEMEKSLSSYLIKCSNMFYGMQPKQVRKLAFEFAMQNKLKVPSTWTDRKIAGRDWFSGFLYRNSNLSIRRPEATSLARMTSFNKTNINEFFDKLESLYRRNNFTATEIYNLDEVSKYANPKYFLEFTNISYSSQTGITTVQRVQRVVGKKGQHQIGQVTSRERGELVTQVGIICASGAALPPVWVFPRKRYDENRMMKGLTQTGAQGLVHKSGWMTCENFILVLEHLVKHSHCSVQHKILLILDNHSSHISIEAIDFCRNNGICMLTLPPHTSNKTQPLDRTVFGPFKTCFNQNADGWMMANPGQTLSIFDLPPLCALAWDRAATPINIKSGFRCTGIWPYDRNIFSDEDFLSSFVTDRSMNKENRPMNDEGRSVNNEADPNIAGPFHRDLEITICKPSNNNSDFVSPEIIRPYPKAGLRKGTRKGRMKKKSIIATDTPEKDALLAEKMRRGKNLPALEKAKKKVLESSSESETEVVLADESSDNLEFEDLNESDKIENGSHIIARVYRNKAKDGRNFVARVFNTAEKGYEVDFFKRLFPANRFSITGEKALILKQDVVAKLPNPITDTRARFKDSIYFNVDLLQYSLL